MTEHHLTSTELWTIIGGVATLLTLLFMVGGLALGRFNAWLTRKQTEKLKGYIEEQSSKESFDQLKKGQEAHAKRFAEHEANDAREFKELRGQIKKAANVSAKAVAAMRADLAKLTSAVHLAMKEPTPTDGTDEKGQGGG